MTRRDGGREVHQEGEATRQVVAQAGLVLGLNGHGKKTIDKAYVGGNEAFKERLRQSSITTSN